MHPFISLLDKYRAEIIATIALVVSILSYCDSSKEEYFVSNEGSQATNIWPIFNPTSPKETVCILPNDTRVQPTGITGIYDGPTARNTHLSEVAFEFSACKQTKGFMFTKHMRKK